jgi:hypothetical protein
MKRTLTLGAVWTASAAAAVGLGFLAVSLVDASASPGTFSTTTSAADSALPTPSAAAATTGGADDTSGPLVPPPLASVEQATAGGTVYAGCADGQPVLASAPGAGWWVDDSSSPDRVEFRTGTQSIEVRVTCATGSPQFSVAGPRADQRGGSTGTPSAVSSPARPTVDDSTGRVGGGHGADDGAGDDSSGRSGGGHGSDG